MVSNTIPCNLIHATMSSVWHHLNTVPNLPGNLAGKILHITCYICQTYTPYEMCHSTMMSYYTFQFKALYWCWCWQTHFHTGATEFSQEWSRSLGDWCTKLRGQQNQKKNKKSKRERNKEGQIKTERERATRKEKRNTTRRNGNKCLTACICFTIYILPCSCFALGETSMHCHYALAGRFCIRLLWIAPSCYASDVVLVVPLSIFLSLSTLFKQTTETYQ